MNTNDNSSTNENNKNSLKVKFLFDISTNAFSIYDIDNSFLIFKSLKDITYLLYPTKNSIIIYNLNKQQVQSELKNSNEDLICCLRHCTYSNKDIIMTVSYNNKIKLWDIFSWENILTLNNINIKNNLYSACFLNYNNQAYIVSSNGSFDIDIEEKVEKIKIFDFKGTKIKEINDSESNTFLIDTYYDKNKSKCYIITGNLNYIISYDYENNSLYHKYVNGSSYGQHVSFIVYEKESLTIIIDSCNNDKFIRIWDFHTGFILNKINTFEEGIFGTSLFDESYLFIGCMSGVIKCINLKTGVIIHNLMGHENRVNSVKTLFHPIYGNCLISQGWLSDSIKLWAIKTEV